MRPFRLLATVAVLALLVGSTPAQAQVEKPLFIEGYGAFVIPTGDYADAVKASPGVGAGFGFYASPAIVLMGNFNWGFMSAKEPIFPKQDLFSAFAMVGYDLTAAQPDVGVILFGGVGGTQFKTKPETGDSESTTKLAINGGAKATFWVSPQFGIMGAANVAFSFTSDSETGAGNTVFFPLTFGLAVRF